MEPPTDQGLEIPKGPKPTPQSFNGDISLQLPTELVELPSKGVFYGQESTLHGRSEIEIKQLTAKEEDILSSEEYLKKGTVLDKLIESILIDKSIDPKDFLVGDRNAILLAARVTAYGADYTVISWCDHCHAETEHVFDLQQCALPKSGSERPEGVT